MLKAIFTNSVGILLSRILGFIRDLLSAQILGANIYSDIFFVSFKLPNLFRRIFAEGAFSQSFLPSFIAAKYKAKFTLVVFSRLLFAILVLSVFVNIFSEQATKLIAFGFSQDAVQIAKKFVAINFYYLDLIFIASFLSALLYYKKHFATSSFSPALLNVALICALLFGANKAPQDVVFYLSLGVIAGGVLQAAAHVLACQKLGMLRLFWIGFRFKKRHRQDEARFNAGFLPAILGSSASHLSAFLDTFLASFLVSGSISYLYYANRIFQLPLAVFAIAVSTALFPSVARAIIAQEEQKALAYLKKSFWILSFLLGAATLGGVVLSDEIIRLLFLRGAFSQADANVTSGVLQMYMIGLLPFGLAKIFSLWLYSHSRQKTAAIIVAKSLALNALLAAALIAPLAEQGLALASSLGGLALLIFSVKEFGFRRFLGFFDTRLVLVFCTALLLEWLALKAFKIFVLG